ncbi:MAG TPA: HlyD family efflux transporter periplasmic adaptor subunit [Holophagaceae bacterium]|nr:HlyD family efflux transporter periplasmic adaptor subunit [Holophagaceae bacterium]
MNPKWSWGLGALLLAGLGGAFAFRPSPVPVELHTVRRGPFELELVGDGKTRVRERHVATAPQAGRLLRPVLKAGDPVTQGQVIAEILPADPALLDPRTTQELRERLGAAEAARDRSRAALAQAEVALAHARTEEARIRRLAEKRAVSAQERERAETTAQLAARERDAALHQSHAADHDLSLATAALARSGGAAGLKPWALRSPVAGRVLRVLHESGGPIALGAPILELGDPSDLEVVVDLPTEEAALVPVGAPARLERWGGPEVLALRVRRVEPSAFTKVSPLGVEEQRVNVILDADHPPATLGDAFQVEVHLRVERRDSVLTLPTAALFRKGDDWCVFQAEAGRARLRPVTLGRRGDRTSWISAGLPEGALVIAYPSDALAEGVRVRPR